MMATAHGLVPAETVLVINAAQAGATVIARTTPAMSMLTVIRPSQTSMRALGFLPISLVEDWFRMSRVEEPQK